MLNQLKYSFLRSIREKLSVFWIFAFPIILCSLFYSSFGHVDSTKIETIKTALVIKSQGEESKYFRDLLSEISNDKSKVISVKEMTDSNAKSQLKKGKISGIFYADKEPELMVAGNGIDESVLQSILGAYNKKSAFVKNIMKEKPEKLAEISAQIGSESKESKEYVKEATLNGKKTDGMIQYFYALIAMTCLFGSFMGTDSAMNLQANIKAVGARRCVSPTNKITMILSDLIVICGLNFTAVIILIEYMKRILKLDIGSDIPKTILVSFVGSLIGISMGLFVGSIGKWKESTKVGIILTVSLGSSFLSGLMVGGIKGIIEEYCPIVNRINPASVLTDAFYCMSIYNNPARFTRDVVTMIITTVIFVIGAFLMLRRVRYDSI